MGLVFDLAQLTCQKRFDNIKAYSGAAKTRLGRLGKRGNKFFSRLLFNAYRLRYIIKKKHSNCGSSLFRYLLLKVHTLLIITKKVNCQLRVRRSQTYSDCCLFEIF